jgi:hypothetical protein
MAAHFDLSRFRNPPPQLAALLTSSTPQEDEMSDSHKGKPRKPDAVDATAAGAAATEPSTEQIAASEGDQPAEAAPSAPMPAAAAESPQLTTVASAADADPADPAHQQAPPAAPVPPPRASAQVIDLDAVRAEERRATLAYVAEVHELCAIAGRGDLAAGLIGKATPIAQVRRALLEARAAEDEATAIRSQVRPATVEPAQPAIDTAAIYAARNQHCR